MRQDEWVRRDTAVRRLATIAGNCQRASGLWDDGEPVLVAAYAFGDLLDGAAELAVVQVAFVLNLPADELTWCAEPGSCTSLAHLSPASPGDTREQLATELEASLAHLRAVEASYWERDWRRDHRGFGIYPESHLWNAVHGYLDLLAALNDG